MELNITKFMQSQNMKAYSASIAETYIENIGDLTWTAAQEYATSHPWTDDLRFLRDMFAEYGAWPIQELDAMSGTELNALLTQIIAGDIREYETYQSDAEYQQGADNGQASGSIYHDPETGDYTYYLNI